MSLLSLTDINVVSIIQVIFYKIAIDPYKYYVQMTLKGREEIKNDNTIYAYILILDTAVHRIMNHQYLCRLCPLSSVQPIV